MNEASVERTVLVTDGAGFIGSAVCRHLIRGGRARVINLDKLTYAASLDSVAEIAASPRYRFAHGDIGDRALVAALLAESRSMRSCTSPPRIMSIVRLPMPGCSSRPTSPARIGCLRRRSITGAR